jgi:hypothetical protein
MLVELKPITQIPGEPRRRFFVDKALDLYVWFNKSDSIVGFQLSYDKQGIPRALTWLKDKGYSLDRIDDGERHPLQPKATPILIPDQDGAFNKQAVAASFLAVSQKLDKAIAAFVLEKVSQY